MLSRINSIQLYFVYRAQQFLISHTISTAQMKQREYCSLLKYIYCNSFKQLFVWRWLNSPALGVQIREHPLLPSWRRSAQLIWAIVTGSAYTVSIFFKRNYLRDRPKRSLLLNTVLLSQHPTFLIRTVKLKIYKMKAYSICMSLDPRNFSVKTILYPLTKSSISVWSQ